MARREASGCRVGNGMTSSASTEGMRMTADEIIRLLALQPHPEGGHYRETFRDPGRGSGGGASGRAHSTAIYFLLQAGEVSRWHRVDAAEAWHWYARRCC